MLMQRNPHRIKGFTLVELLMTVAIIGILAAVALPSYQNSIRKSRRQVAISDMLLYKQAEEKFRSSNLAYGSISEFNDPSNAAKAQYYVKTSSQPTDYSFSIVATTTTYTISAFPQGNQAQGYESSCSPLTLTETDARGPSDKCWAR